MKIQVNHTHKPATFTYHSTNANAKYRTPHPFDTYTPLSHHPQPAFSNDTSSPAKHPSVNL